MRKAEVPSAPQDHLPTRADHLARVAVCLVFLANGAAWGGWAPHVATMIERLGVREGQMGLALLLCPLASTLTMPLSGRIIQRYGSRRVTLIASVLLTATMPFFTASHAWGPFIAALILAGLFNAQMDVAMNTNSIRVQERFNRPILSNVHGWWSVGGFSSGLWATAVAKLGYSPVFHQATFAGLLLLSFVFVYRHLLDAPENPDEHVPMFIIPKGTTLAIGLMLVCAFLAEGSIFEWKAAYLRRVLDAPEWLGAFGFSCFAIAAATGRFLGDRVIARFGHVRTIRYGALMGMIGGAIGVFAPHPAVAIFGFSTLALGMANSVPILFKSTSYIPGVSAAVALAAATNCGYAGWLMGPPTIGLVAEVSNLRWALSITILLCAIVMLLAPKILRERTTLR